MVEATRGLGGGYYITRAHVENALDLQIQLQFSFLMNQSLTCTQTGALSTIIHLPQTRYRVYRGVRVIQGDTLCWLRLGKQSLSPLRGDVACTEQGGFIFRALGNKVLGFCKFVLCFRTL